MRNRRWVDLIKNEAAIEFKADLEKMAMSEDSLSRAKDLESLYYQRGVVAGIRRVLNLVMTPNN